MTDPDRSSPIGKALQPPDGHGWVGSAARRPPWTGALLLILSLPVFWSSWGFTVDDAWIISRVASHGAEGHGYTFLAHQSPSDAVTPLGFARLIGSLGWLIGRTEPLELWQLARWLGLACCCTALYLAGFWSNCRRHPAILGCLLLGTSVTLVWAGAGLATPVVSLLLLLGGRQLIAKKRSGGACWLGVACALRPELLGFSAGVCLATWAKHAPPRHTFAAQTAGGLLLPVLLVALIRTQLFDSWLPLSASAKQPDFASGVFYCALSAIWWGAGWWIVFAPGKVLSRQPDALLVGYVGHLVCLVAVGGDWMPALRLTAPLGPLALWWALSLPPERAVRLRWLAPLSALLPAWLLFQQADDFRRVTARRLHLVEEGKKALAGAKTVAAVDVGWLGLSHPGAIVDLGGATDARIARLPGGHTSKHIAPGMFSDRNIDAWVVRDRKRNFRPGAAIDEIAPAYVVDARLLRRLTNLGLEPHAQFALPGTSGQYVVFRRSEKRSAHQIAGESQ